MSYPGNPQGDDRPNDGYGYPDPNASPSYPQQQQPGRSGPVRPVPKK